MQTTGSIIVLAVGLLLACAAVWLILANIENLHRRRAWRTALGRIVDKQPATYDSDDDSYTARVVYEYELSSTGYRGSADVTWEKSDFSRPYRVGNQLLIAYDPDRPGEGVPAEDMEGSISIILGIALGVVMLGGALFVFGFALVAMFGGLSP